MRPSDIQAPDSARQVTVVLVTYNSASVIGPCLDSIPGACAIVVVDNASTDGTPEAVAHARADATIIRNVANRGFGTACNQGLAFVATDFVLFLNPDTLLHPNALESLVSVFSVWPDAGLVGPRIVNAHGVLVESCSPSRLRRGRRVSPVMPEASCCVDFLLGAALMARTNEFRVIGGFDESIFLFYEDDDLCVRYRAAGRALVYEPAASVTHLYGLSSGSSGELSAFKAEQMAWSRLYIVNKHRGAMALAVEAVLRLGWSMLHWLLAALRASSEQRRTHAARLRGSLLYLCGRGPR
jgi:GT2 family glycosyltransferase